MKVTFIIILLLSTFIQVESQSIDNLFDTYHTSHYTEKIYVAMDKPYYVLEDEIWAKVYMVYGRSHVPMDSEPIIYAEWIDPDGNIKDKYQLKIKNGIAPFSIKTSLYDKVGTYKLRVYSPYQLNFDADYIWQKEIQLLNSAEYSKSLHDSTEELSIQFFPEGGFLVNDLECMLAYKIKGAENPNNFKGTIKDQDGNIVTDFSIWKHGLGRIDLTPKSGKKYVAELEYDGIKKHVDLPSRLEKGYIISADSQDEEKIRITLNTNLPAGLNGTHLLAHVRGELVSSFVLDQSSSKIVLALEKDKMPSGIIHLTLFDPKYRPVSERLVFNRNPKEQIETSIKVKAQVGKRELVTSYINAFLDSTAISAIANISVYNKDVLPDEWRGIDIQSYLWLQSDLKGNIDHIGDYLLRNNKRNRSVLDLTLATHGWRRFEWQKVLQSEYPKLETFSEETTVVNGQISKLSSKKPVKADVTLNILNDELFAALKLTTNEDGYFQFQGINLPDSTDILIQAGTHKKKSSKKSKEGSQKLLGNRYVKIVPTALPTMGLDSVEALTHYPFEGESEENLESETSTQSTNRSIILDDTFWSLSLDEVVVSTRRFSAQARNDAIQKRYKEKGIFFFASTDKFLADDPQYDGLYYNTIHEMLKVMIPGAKRTTKGGLQSISIGPLSANQTARIAVNGELIPIDRERLISPADVYALDIVRGLRALALYDNPLVVSIITRDPDDPAKITSPGIFNINHPGYHKARTFYTPSQEDLLGQKDYRTTIFWDPNVQLKSGQHNFTFKTSDLMGVHQIVIEGLTAEGIPFVKRKSFVVAE